MKDGITLDGVLEVYVLISLKVQLFLICYNGQGYKNPLIQIGRSSNIITKMKKIIDKKS